MAVPKYTPFEVVIRRVGRAQEHNPSYGLRATTGYHFGLPAGRLEYCDCFDLHQRRRLPEWHPVPCL